MLENPGNATVSEPLTVFDATGGHGILPNMDQQLSQPNDPATTTARACPLSVEEIAEFREIVREETGVDLPEAEAWNRAIELVALFRMLLGPLPEDPER